MRSSLQDQCTVYPVEIGQTPPAELLLPPEWHIVSRFQQYWQNLGCLRCRTLTSLPHRRSLRMSWIRLLLWAYSLAKVIR